MIKKHTGIDEAALGPILGPYCATAVSFKYESTKELFDLFSVYSNVKIADSKKLYKSGSSLTTLETTVVSFATLFSGSYAKNLLELIESVVCDKQSINQLQSIPWYTEMEELILPLNTNKDKLEDVSKDLGRFMKKNNIEIDNIIMDIVPALRFNQLLDTGLNKSEVCQKILSPLITGSISDGSRIMVDRQGGRRYYGEWMVETFPNTPISIIKETKELSSYNIGNSTIHFQVKGDDKYMETALASIFSKYLRELLMKCFNNYWQKIAPSLKRTAGYPQDGKRFIQDLVKNDIGFNENILIRKR